MSNITQTDSFEKLMDTVGILRTHYSKITKLAEREMLKARMKKDMTTANKYAEKLDQMAQDYRAALDAIADKITSPKELNDTRKVVRDAASKAHGFIKALEKTKITLKQLETAAGFIADITTDIVSIVT